MSQEKEYLGMYSAEAASLYGTTFWADADGCEHEITATAEKPEDYRWPDAILVAKVVRFIRNGLPGTVKDNFFI